MNELGKYQQFIIDSLAETGLTQVANLRAQLGTKKIAFASGCYDLIHPGHVIFFEQLKQIAEIVIIGLGRDSVLKALKPNRPIIDEISRAYMLASLKPVDYVILDSNEIEAGKIDFKPTITALLPDFLVLNSDDSAIQEKTILCKELGIELKLVDRIVPDFLPATSTTAIISKIQSFD